MTQSADDFNEDEYAAGRLRSAHVSELVARFQREHGLDVDGKAGPKTRAMIELLRGKEPGGPPAEVKVPARVTTALPEFRDLAPLAIDPDGWLVGPDVTRLEMHRSWLYARLDTPNGRPRAIVAHYTATDPGTARAMFVRRAAALQPLDRQASWHVSIETDGRVYQGASFLRGCWHAGSPTAKGIPGVGPANRTSVGIELVGHGKEFPEAQVAAAARVWHALAVRYSIPRELAMVTHAELDPGRKADPGPVWMSLHAPRVLRYTFG